MPPDATEVVITTDDAGAADEARASAAAAAQAASAAIADAAHVAAAAETAAAAEVETIAEDTLEELNESERRLSSWLAENQQTNLTLHQETRQQIQSLQQETAAAITGVLEILKSLTPPKSEEVVTATIIPAEQTRTAAQPASGDGKPAAPGQGKRIRRRI